MVCTLPSVKQYLWGKSEVDFDICIDDCFVDVIILGPDQH